MSLVIDVNWASFRQFLREDGTMFYIESSRQFLLIKPVSNYFLRTYIMKDGTPKDLMFRQNELISRGAMPVISFNFNDKQVTREVVLESKDEVNQDNPEVSNTEVDLPSDIKVAEKDVIKLDGVITGDDDD